VTTLLGAHADAVLDLLRDEIADVRDGAVDGELPAPPYAVVHLHMERPRNSPGNAADGVSAELTVVIYLHSIGETAAAARNVASAAGDALIDVIPTVAGRVCGPITHRQSVPPDQPNETTGVPVHDYIDVYRFVSEPA
jgi:hypothetical protein